MAKPTALPASAPRPATLHRQLWRTGLAVVGGSVFASACFVHLSLTQLGDVDYAGAMIAATVIPLVVASLAFLWIASLTVRLDTSRGELEQLALCDPLTGLANRRAAMARLGQWAAASDPIALAIADIDFFKRVNDRLGHDGGDASLVHFAAMLSTLLPQDWLTARIGGEEFLIAAPTGDFAAFAAGIEALRMAVAETPLITPAGPYQLTVSFGLAARRTDDSGAGESFDRLITRADLALYAAKQGGRNRIEQAA